MLTHPRYALVTELVVALALGRVTEHFVRFSAFFEFDFGFDLAVAVVAVGVILHRQLAIGALDLVVAATLRDAKHLVIIPFHRGHVIWCSHNSSMSSFPISSLDFSHD